ncbi:glycoside hydrolase family 19 protein [Rhizohabitans arisaemae]|uniref:glycoside hydrolase family 19 protein n=1 Tax=Rhizohabitans arisaemae TaxID=2720610 RepID=UPI0024B0B53E|nr:glycoside hydrolase family 19 protein [Rhizohabitans arisaemae]
MRNRIMTTLAALAVAGATLVALPAASSASSTPVPICASAWDPAKGYAGGLVASHNGRNWRAKWWTRGNVPGGPSGIWQDKGVCDNRPGTFVVTEAQFNEMFPNRNPFYTYQGLVTALSAYPAFAGTGSDLVKKQEAAAFLANVAHETIGLVNLYETNTANYPLYCHRPQPYGCPAGINAYYGRGPIMLSWNFNYKSAGDALEIDLLNNPNLVQTEPQVAWMTGIWYWMTASGPGTMTPHRAMVDSRGFGETIRSINGFYECDGRNPWLMQNRVNNYQRITGILGIDPGTNLTC